MKLDNKTCFEMTEEITLTDTELAVVLGGCNSPSYGGGYPSYGGGYPSYGGGYPSYGGGYPSSCGGSSPSYGGGYPSYGGGYPSSCGGGSPSYSNPFDTGSSSSTSYLVTVTTTYTPVSSSCGGN